MAGIELGTAYINIVASSAGLGRSIAADLHGAEAAAGAAGAGAGKSFGGGLLAGAKKFAGPVAGVFAGVSAFGFFKDSVGAASDLAESGTKIAQIFGPATADVQAFAGQGAKALGQSKLEALNAAAAFGTYGKAAGLQEGALSGFATSLSSLSTDLASFYNTDPAEAAEAIAAGLRGESEPLRKFGVLLDDATLRNKALQLGLIATTKEALTPQQKVLAAQAAIMEQTSDAQGDFARTSGGLANQQRIMSASFSDASARLGEKLLPVITAIVTWINEKLLPAIEWLAPKVAAVFKVIGDVISFAWNNVIMPVFNAIKGAVTSTIEFFANFGTRLSEFGAWIADAFGNVLAWFASLPGRIWDAVVALGGKLLALGGWLITTIWDGIKSGAVAFWGWFTSLPGWIWDKVTALPGKILDLGMWIIKTIVRGLGDLAAGFWDFLGWIGGLVYKGLTGLITLGAQAIGWVVIGLGQGVWDILQWLGDMVSRVWQGIRNLGARIGNAILDGLRSVLLNDSWFMSLFNPGVGSAVGRALGGGGGGSRGFATGGWVDPKPGGHFVNVGEGGQREWIIPDPLLNKVIANAGARGGSGGSTVINVYPATGAVAPEAIVRALRQHERTAAYA